MKATSIAHMPTWHCFQYILSCCSDDWLFLAWKRACLWSMSQSRWLHEFCEKACNNWTYLHHVRVHDGRRGILTGIDSSCGWNSVTERMFQVWAQWLLLFLLSPFSWAVMPYSFTFLHQMFINTCSHLSSITIIECLLPSPLAIIPTM